MKAIQIERSFRVPSELFPVLQPEWSVAAAALPELDASSAVTEQWSTVIWKYICHRHGGAPETSALKRLVEHESDASRHAPANEHAARNRIRQALHDAFVRLLRKKTPRTR